MDPDFYKRITSGTAHRKCRDDNKYFVLENTVFLEDLTTIAFDYLDKNHYKAYWILELICEENIELFTPFINKFCEKLSSYTKDHTKRPVSKICMLLTKSNKIQLSEFQEQKIIEACFDWLIQDEKVAAKVYAMRSLFLLEKKHEWINPEIKTILSQDYSQQSPGYKACAKDILKRLK
jgi:hypothetical protein